MAPACTVCIHGQREAIDQAIVARRESIRSIARQYGLTKDSVLRHQASHVSSALTRLVQQHKQSPTERRNAVRLLDRIMELTDRAEALLERAEQSGSVVQALAAVRELRGMYELLGKATGELKDAGTTVQVLNVIASPEMQQVIGVILAELRDQPELRVRIGQRLVQLDQPALQGAVA